MLGLLLALQAIFNANELARHTASEPWVLEASSVFNTGLAVANTHRAALRRIKSGATGLGAIQGTRQERAVGIRICADANRMLTAYGPVNADEAPEILDAIRKAVHPAARIGFIGKVDDEPTADLPSGCSVPANHVWIGTALH